MMKTLKIMIIDGGPRRNMNTAGMLQSFAEGAASTGKEVEVKTVRLYELDYKGCMSCMACKIKGRASHICKFKDALTPILEEIAQADYVSPGFRYERFSSRITLPARPPSTRHQGPRRHRWSPRLHRFRFVCLG